MLDDAYKNLVSNLGVNPETANIALSRAIERAFGLYLHTPDCVVDLDARTVNVVMRVPEDMAPLEASIFDKSLVNHDTLGITFDLRALPKPVIRHTAVIFNEMLIKLKADEDYAMWRTRVHEIYEGVILEKTSETVIVDLNNGTRGIMPRNRWVIPEERFYRPGKMMSFYVGRVQRVGDRVSVYLSRCTKHLPALLLKKLMPLNKFICQKRYGGQKSIIFTDATTQDPKFKKHRSTVSKDLNGEVLETRPFSSKPPSRKPLSSGMERK